MSCTRPCFGGGKNPGLAGSDPPLRGSLPANLAAFVLLRPQHYFMQVLPPPWRRPATKNLVITSEQANRAHPSQTGVATKATNATKAGSVPRMPQGVRLVRCEPKPAPVLLTHMAVVTDVTQFICATLKQLDMALHSKQGPASYRKARELVDRLEQCGVVVKISGVGSPSGGRR